MTATHFVQKSGDHVTSKLGNRRQRSVMESRLQLVFKGPVRSGYGAPAHPNRDRDQSHFFCNLQLTGPNHY